MTQWAQELNTGVWCMSPAALLNRVMPTEVGAAVCAPRRGA